MIYQKEHGVNYGLLWRIPEAIKCTPLRASFIRELTEPEVYEFIIGTELMFRNDGGTVVRRRVCHGE